MAFAPLNLPYPFTPLMQSRTLKKFDIGYARNGEHIVNMKPLPVWLHIAPSEGICWECESPIHCGTVYGKSNSRGNFCRACIYVPKFAGAYQVTFSIGRRSRKHPNGTITKDFISSGSKVVAYVRELKAEGRKVNVIKLTNIINKK